MILRFTSFSSSLFFKRQHLCFKTLVILRYLLHLAVLVLIYLACNLLSGQNIIFIFLRTGINHFVKGVD